MVKKRFQGKKLSHLDFLKSPSDSLPPPSPASPLSSRSSRDIWSESLKSVMTPPTREDGRLLVPNNHRSTIPFAQPPPLPPRSYHRAPPSRLSTLVSSEDLNKHVCDPGSSIGKMKNDKNDKDRSQITKKIERFVDWMAEHNVPNGNWIDGGKMYMFEESLCVNRETGLLCKKGTMCKNLPDHENQKRFIPQLYHLLQDYDLFGIHMSIMNNDEKNSMLELNEKIEVWKFRKIRHFETYNPIERIDKYKELLVKIRRIQFLRSFDVKCCFNGENNHPEMDKTLRQLFNTIQFYVKYLTGGYDYRIYQNN